MAPKATPATAPNAAPARDAGVPATFSSFASIQEALKSVKPAKSGKPSKPLFNVDPKMDVKTVWDEIFTSLKTGSEKGVYEALASAKVVTLGQASFTRALNAEKDARGVARRTRKTKAATAPTATA